jgi:hypothetical protein
MLKSILPSFLLSFPLALSLSFSLSLSTESHYVVQPSLKLEISLSLLSAGITGVYHCTQLRNSLLKSA